VSGSESLSLFHLRRSVRSFKEAPVSRHDLEKIVVAASLAPSARNIQPWEFIVVQDKKRLALLASLVAPNGSFIAGAGACLVILCRDTKYYLEDGAAATTQALLCAAGLGLGACWVAGDKKEYASGVLEALEAPAYFKLISLVALGVPNESPDVSKRALSEVLHWEHF
jgi:nitroreductase